MSDSLSTPASELVRKRSRSTSPNAANEFPANSKKPNSSTTGPTTLTHDDQESGEQNSTTTTADVTTSTTGDATKMQTDEDSAKTSTGDESAPMNVDAETGVKSLPAIPQIAASGQEKAAGNEPTAEETAAAAAAAMIQMRALIVTQDASIIIGKQGKNVNEIREKSGSKITITESVPGNPERIMAVAGQLDAVSKAFGLIVRRINDEPFDVPSVPGSRAVTIRFIIPNARMGSVIGKGGSKIKEIQEASGARLQASEAMLPGSTERVLSVSGVADAVHIAVYYIGTILQENPGMAANTTSYRPSGGYQPAMGGEYMGARAAPVMGAYGGAPPRSAPVPMPGPGAQTQQIFIPNELVGSIIGKGGAKINEVRQMSQCQVKINEPGEGAPGSNPNERLVTITGQPVGIQTAVRLLYQRLEQEKAKQMGAA